MPHMPHVSGVCCQIYPFRKIVRTPISGEHVAELVLREVGTLIEADPVISQQLSLWQQAGRTVQRGHLRMVPTDSAILYIQPLFLSAQDRGIPQLQRVIVTDGTAVSMAGTLSGAIADLLGETVAADLPEASPDQAPGGPVADWRARAIELMRQADERLRAGDFAGFGAAWNQLRALLEQQARDDVPR